MFDPVAVETAAHIIAAQRSGIWYTADLIAWLRSQQPPPPPRLTEYWQGYSNAIEKLIETLEKTALPQLPLRFLASKVFLRESG